MTTTFKQFINEIRVTSLSNWQYELPEDKEEQMFDFYMLTLFPKEVGDPDLNHHLQECKNILLFSLKKELLRDVFYAIIREIKHVSRMSSKESLKKVLNEKQFKSLNKYFKISTKIKNKIIKNFYVKDYVTSDENIRKYLNEKHKDMKNKLSNNYEKLFEKEDKHKTPYLLSSLKSGLTEKQFVQMCKILFESDNEIKWESEYGGKKWGSICDGWLNLYNAKTTDNVMVWIDHIYDLEHNTGSIFNKLYSYRKGKKAWYWIKDSLNLKKTIETPYEIIKNTSAKMKILALPIIKSTKSPGEQALIPRKDQLETVNVNFLKYTYGSELYKIIYKHTSPRTILELSHDIAEYYNQDLILPKLDELKWKEETELASPYNILVREFTKLYSINYHTKFIKENYRFYITRDIITYVISKEKNINNVKSMEQIEKIFKILSNESIVFKHKSIILNPSLSQKITDLIKNKKIDLKNI